MKYTIRYIVVYKIQNEIIKEKNKSLLTIMISKFLIKQIYLIIEDFDTNQHRSLIMPTTANSFVQASLWVFTVLMLMIWVYFHCFGIIVGFVKVKWEKNEVVVEIL